MKFWYWSQPAVAVVLLGFTIYTLVNFIWLDSAGLPSIQFAVNGGFVFPGMLFSLGVSQLGLSRRKPRSVSRTERVLLGIEFGLLAVLIVSSLDQAALTFGIIGWPLLIILAITISLTIAATMSRLKAAETVADSPPSVR